MHLQSLFNTFVVLFLDSITTLVATSEISRLKLASVVKQAGLRLTWLHTCKTGFLILGLILLIQQVKNNMIPIMRKPVFGVSDQIRHKLG